LLVASGCQDAAPPHAAPAAQPKPAQPALATTPVSPKLVSFADLAFDWAKVLPPGSKRFDPPHWYKYERGLIPSSAEGLEGRQVRIRGFIAPMYAEQFTQFLLVPEQLHFPLHGLPSCIIVTLPPEAPANFTSSPVEVVGHFRIEEYPDPLDPDANPVAVYWIDRANVAPVNEEFEH
jgi:hypothetical protein